MWTLLHLLNFNVFYRNKNHNPPPKLNPYPFHPLLYAILHLVTTLLSSPSFSFEWPTCRLAIIPNLGWWGLVVASPKGRAIEGGLGRGRGRSSDQGGLYSLRNEVFWGGQAIARAILMLIFIISKSINVPILFLSFCRQNKRQIHLKLYPFPEYWSRSLTYQKSRSLHWIQYLQFELLQNACIQE